MMLIILGNLDLFFCKLLIIKIIQEKFSSFQNISFFLIYLESVNYNIIIFLKINEIEWLLIKKTYAPTRTNS